MSTEGSPNHRILVIDDNRSIHEDLRTSCTARARARFRASPWRCATASCASRHFSVSAEAS